MFRHELVSHEQRETSTICAVQKVLKEEVTCSLELCMSCVPSLSLKPVSLGGKEMLSLALFF